jgi:predicted DNA-binding transcriptional regulator AlpA
MLDRILRPKETSAVTGLSLTTLWRKEKKGTFPKRRKISTSASGHLESEVAVWQEDPEGWPEKQGREDVSV